MPNIKSAVKRMRSDEKKRQNNNAALSELKTLEKGMRQAAETPKKAEEFAKRLVARFDRAVTRGIVKRGTADRKKSRIAHFIASLSKKKSKKA